MRLDKMGSKLNNEDKKKKQKTVGGSD